MVVDIEMGDKEVDIDVGIELTDEIFRYDINLNILISLMIVKRVRIQMKSIPCPLISFR